MVRRAADGRHSLIDLVSELTRTSKRNALFLLRRLADKGIIQHYDAISLPGGRPTQIVTDAEWAEIRSHLPSDTYLTRRRDPDDLYVMQYSDAHDAVKIGRSRDVEKRRRDLEAGHNFFVSVAAVFPGLGHIEAAVHDRLQMFRSHAGAGREWFNISKHQAIATIRFVQSQKECQLGPRKAAR